MNLIVNAFAFKDNYGGSMQMNNRSDIEKLSAYMKNLTVALISAKLNNPNDEVMLVCTSEPFSPYKEMLSDAGIIVKNIPFDSFIMPKEFPWALAFYKLCVMKHLSMENDYDRILLMDTDTVTVRSYEEMWKEANHGILLYDICHPYDHKDRAIIKEAYNNLYPEKTDNVIHYGGEYIAGTPEKLRLLMESCERVYEDIKKSDYNIPRNSSDEVILSIAAIELFKSGNIYSAGAYIYRYWTENMFYLVSTNTVYNPVCIWHFPVEKDTGIILLYNYYVKHKCFPDINKSAKILGLTKAKRPFSIYTYLGRLERKRSHLKAK